MDDSEVEDYDDYQYEVSLPDPANPGHFVTVCDPTSEDEAIKIAKQWGADDNGKINLLNIISM